MINSVQFDSEAKADYEAWKQNNGKLYNKINTLIGDIIKHPFSGLGKPEALKHELSGLWSRHIDKKNRLVYYIDGENLRITSCRFHYDHT
jgi:toxin YoeB